MSIFVGICLGFVLALIASLVQGWIRKRKTKRERSIKTRKIYFYFKKDGSGQIEDEETHQGFASYGRDPNPFETVEKYLRQRYEVMLYQYNFDNHPFHIKSKILTHQDAEFSLLVNESLRLAVYVGFEVNRPKLTIDLPVSN